MQNKQSMKILLIDQEASRRNSYSMKN